MPIENFQTLRQMREEKISIDGGRLEWELERRRNRSKDRILYSVSYVPFRPKKPFPETGAQCQIHLNRAMSLPIRRPVSSVVGQVVLLNRHLASPRGIMLSLAKRLARGCGICFIFSQVVRSAASHVPTERPLNTFSPSLTCSTDNETAD